jgi:hypothetical protein
MAKIKVAIIGPCSKGMTFRVHAAGCRDIGRECSIYGVSKRDTMEHSIESKRDAAEFMYGPAAGSFYEEAGGDAVNGSLAAYLDGALESDFHFSPCVKLDGEGK